MKRDTDFFHSLLAFLVLTWGFDSYGVRFINMAIEWIPKELLLNPQSVDVQRTSSRGFWGSWKKVASRNVWKYSVGVAFGLDDKHQISFALQLPHHHIHGQLLVDARFRKKALEMVWQGARQRHLQLWLLQVHLIWFLFFLISMLMRWPPRNTLRNLRTRWKFIGSMRNIKSDIKEHVPYQHQNYQSNIVTCWISRNERIGKCLYLSQCHLHSIWILV